MRLRGNAEGTLDAKGRIAVPTKFRPMFDGKELVLWMPRGVDKPFMTLSTAAYFDAVIDREYAQADKKDRQDVLREALGYMDEIELDSAARFVIPERYYAKAGYERGKKLFFIANETYMEIWALEAWKNWESQRAEALSMVDHTPDPVVRGVGEDIT